MAGCVQPQEVGGAYEESRSISGRTAKGNVQLQKCPPRPCVRFPVGEGDICPCSLQVPPIGAKRKLGGEEKVVGQMKKYMGSLRFRLNPVLDPNQYNVFLIIN